MKQALFGLTEGTNRKSRHRRRRQRHLAKWTSRRTAFFSENNGQDWCKQCRKLLPSSKTSQTVALLLSTPCGVTKKTNRKPSCRLETGTGCQQVCIFLCTSVTSYAFQRRFKVVTVFVYRHNPAIPTKWHQNRSGYKDDIRPIISRDVMSVENGKFSRLEKSCISRCENIFSDKFDTFPDRFDLEF